MEIGRAATIEGAVKREQPRLFEFIRRRIRDESDAEDILQDVFFQLASTYSVTEPIEDLTAWLFTVARNKLTDWYRKRRPERLPEPRDASEGRRLPDPEEMLVDPSADPDLRYWRAMVWDELADALEELPPEQRDAFVWNELEGRSFKEISEATGVPLSTLLSRKRYAVRALRGMLQDVYDELE